MAWVGGDTSHHLLVCHLIHMHDKSLTLIRTRIMLSLLPLPAFSSFYVSDPILSPPLSPPILPSRLPPPPTGPHVGMMPSDE